MKVGFFIYLLTIFNAERLFCSFDLTPVTGKSLAMGQALSAASSGAAALFQNPSGLCESTKMDICLSYSRPFGLADLDSWTFAGHAGFLGLDLGLGFHGFGSAVYSEKTLCLAAAAPFGGFGSAGLQARFLRLDIRRYGAADARVLDAGMQIRFSAKTTLGLAFTNTGNQTLGRRHDALPRILRIGIGWKPESFLVCVLEWCRDDRYQGRLNAGLQISLLRSFDIRFGFQSRPAAVSFGFGVAMKKTSLDWGASVHPVLGVTQAYSVTVAP